MITIYNLKPAFQNLLRPTSDCLVKQGVTPNQVTIAAVIISFLTGLVITLFPNHPMALFLVPFVLFIRMVLNAIDGMLAREHHMQTKLGTFLNELGDVFSDIFLYVPFAFVPGISPFLVITTVFLAVISEMTGIISIQAGGSRRYDGPMGKSDRAFVFSGIGLLLGFGIRANIWVNLILVIVGLALVLTITNRIFKALGENP